MAIEWRPALSTGIDWQDAEHRELFAHINELLEAMQHSEARTHMEGLFAFLRTYVLDHFAHEEQAMKETEFGRIGDHCMQHSIFRESMEEIERCFTRQGGSAFVVMRVQRLLAEWLMRHIVTTDKIMADHVLKVLETQHS